MVIFVRLSAINLNQIVVKFTQPVDATAATTVTNYTIGGVDLTTNDKLELSPVDSKTLTINLYTQQAQYGTSVFQVKGNVIYGKTASTSTVPVYSKSLTFSDTAIPTVSTVIVSGNKTLIVVFSESVKVNSATPTAGTMFKIDGSYLTNYGYSSATALNYTGNGYANKILLTFATAIPAGDHTLTTLPGSATNFSDAAGFILATQTTSFNVSSVTTAPTISSVVGQDNGTITVTFDRSMDDNALTLGNYMLNTSTALSNNGMFRADSNKTIVDFTGNSVAVGANILTVTKNTVKDTYGNYLSTTADIRMAFTATADTVKPTVSSVVPLTNSQIRVKYSEAVVQAYATNASNYVLKDSTGIQIAVTATKVAADTYDLTPASALTGTSYTLTIKNIIDTAAAANVIDTYVATFTGSDTTAPTALSAITADATGTVVAITFSEPMDAATLVNSSNYYYIDRASVTRVIPSGVTLAGGADNKSVTITFPSPYKVDTTDALTAQYDVTGIIVGNVKDVAGNTLYNISKTFATITAYGSGSDNPAYVANTFVATASGAAATVSFQLDQNITNLQIADFLVGNATTDYAPASGYVSGKTVYLTFTNDTAVTDIKSYGTGLKLYTVGSPASTNVYGTKIAAIAKASAISVYDDQIAPTLIAITQPSATTIKLQFSEPVDATILGLYADDFSIVSNGELMTVTGEAAATTNVNATNDSVILTLSKSTSGATSVKAVSSAISVKSLANDIAMTSNLYVPTTADITIGTTIADTLAPTLVSVVLANGSGAAGLGIGDTIAFTFSEAMNSTGNTTFGMVDGVVTFQGGKAFTFATPGVNNGTGTISWNAAKTVATLTFTTVTVATSVPSGVVTPSATVLTDTAAQAMSNTASPAATGSL